VYYNCVKFHKNSISSLVGVALIWENFHSPAGRLLIFAVDIFISLVEYYMYASNNHTCSVIPLWRINNSVLFLYPWKEGEKTKIIIIHVEKRLHKYLFLLKMPIKLIDKPG
jgi:hypothetical protein